MEDDNCSIASYVDSDEDTNVSQVQRPEYFYQIFAIRSKSNVDVDVKAINGLAEMYHLKSHYDVNKFINWDYDQGEIDHLGVSVDPNGAKAIWDNINKLQETIITSESARDGASSSTSSFVVLDLEKEGHFISDRQQLSLVSDQQSSTSTMNFNNFSTHEMEDGKKQEDEEQIYQDQEEEYFYENYDLDGSSSSDSIKDEREYELRELLEEEALNRHETSTSEESGQEDDSENETSLEQPREREGSREKRIEEIGPNQEEDIDYKRYKAYLELINGGRPMMSPFRPRARPRFEPRQVKPFEFEEFKQILGQTETRIVYERWHRSKPEAIEEVNHKNSWP